MPNVTLGMRLFRARLTLAQRLGRQVSKAEIAGLAGISPAAYGRYEAGEREPDLAAIERLANVLETTAAYLAFGAGEVLESKTASLYDVLPTAPMIRIEPAAKRGIKKKREA